MYTDVQHTRVDERGATTLARRVDLGERESALPGGVVMVVQRDVEESAGQRRVGDHSWVARAPFNACVVCGILWSAVSKTILKDSCGADLEIITMSECTTKKLRCNEGAECY